MSTLLPTKPSDILLAALADMTTLEGNGVSMVSAGWPVLYAVGDPAPVVAFAGGVCVETLGLVDLSTLTAPYKLRIIDMTDHDDRNKVWFLETVASGAIAMALGFLSIDTPAGVDQGADIAPYEIDPVQFKADIQFVIGQMQTAGI